MDFIDRLQIAQRRHAFSQSHGTAPDTFDQIRAQRAALQPRTDRQRRADGHDIGPGPHHHRHIGHGAARRDMMAQAFQQPPGGADGLGNLGMDGLTGQRGVAQCHAQPARRAADRIGMAVAEGRGHIGRAQIGAHAGIQHHGRIAHRFGQKAVDRHARPSLARHRTVRQARPRWLETEKPAARGRNAHRSAAVRAMGKGHDASGNRRPRPARRSARCMIQVPWVAGWPAINRRLSGRANAAFGTGRATKGDHACRTHPVVNRAVAAVARVGKQPRAVVRGKVHGLAAQILDQKRHATKGPPGQAISDSLAGHGFLDQNDCIQGGVQPFGSGQRQIQHFAGADLPCGDQSCHGGCIQICKVFHRLSLGVFRRWCCRMSRQTRSVAPRHVVFGSAAA